MSMNIYTPSEIPFTHSKYHIAHSYPMSVLILMLYIDAIYRCKFPPKIHSNIFRYVSIGSVKQVHVCTSISCQYITE